MANINLYCESAIRASASACNASLFLPVIRDTASRFCRYPAVTAAIFSSLIPLVKPAFANLPAVCAIPFAMSSEEYPILASSSCRPVDLSVAVNLLNFLAPSVVVPPRYANASPFLDITCPYCSNVKPALLAYFPISMISPPKLAPTLPAVLNEV